MSLEFTERLLTDAGIRSGMKVLDIGCGTGEVSSLVSSIVHDSGSVVGVDINEKAIARARELANARGLSNVEYLHAGLSDLSFPEEEFDAVVGRRILMYLPNATETMRQLSRFVKSGGIFVFQENDTTLGAKGTVNMPLHDQVVHWIWKTVEREGADIHMGFNLPGKMREAGIDVDHVRAEPAIQGQSDHNSLHFIVKAMLPRILEHGVASEEEVDIATLEERLAAERANGAIYISDMAFGVWGHKP